MALAAKRLRLSPSAMSRALARLREATGDPLLAWAGRGLVPTPRALDLRARVSRRGLDEGPIDEALKPLGLKREIVTIVGGFSTALALARGSDLIASVPERHTGNLRAGIHSFPLPVAAPEITVSLLWHP